MGEKEEKNCGGGGFELRTPPVPPACTPIQETLATLTHADRVILLKIIYSDCTIPDHMKVRFFSLGTGDPHPAKNIFGPKLSLPPLTFVPKICPRLGTENFQFLPIKRSEGKNPARNGHAACWVLLTTLHVSCLIGGLMWFCVQVWGVKVLGSGEPP